MSTGSDEGRRVLRNVASFGAFILSPLQMLMLNRALGPAGYGHWWWTFGLLEGAAILGVFGADLFVRRELPRLVREGRAASELTSVIGSGLAVMAVIGLAFAVLQIALSGPLVAAQGDPGLRPFLLLLAVQPVLWNVTGLLSAALQSIDVLAPVALIRGLLVPLGQIALLYGAWRADLPIVTTLVLLIAVSVVALVIIAALYARHFSLRTTLVHAVRPREYRAVIRFGLTLLVPAVLFTAAGKVDLYVLGAHVDAEAVGIYAGCLTLAALLAATRALFDPIVMTQIGALRGAGDTELRASLARMTRQCAFALAPPLVMLVAIGEPVLELLLGRPAPLAVAPLAILCVGQLIGSLAIAGWLIPMGLEGRVLAVIAGATLIVKLGLLFLLVPPFGLIGAAVATAAGTIIAQQSQALIGGHRLGFQPYSASLVPVLVASTAVAIGGRALYVAAEHSFAKLPSALIAGSVSLLALGVVILRLLDPSERATVWRLLGRTPRGA